MYIKVLVYIGHGHITSRIEQPFEDLDPVYTVPDPHGHDIKLDSFKTNVAFKYMNLITTRHRESDKSK